MDRKKFRKIRTETLVDNMEAHFDVYAIVDKDGTNTTEADLLLYAKAPYKWSLRELTELTRVGIHEMFIEEESVKDYERYLSMHEETPKVDRTVAPRFRLKSIEDIGQHLIESCFLAEIDEKKVSKLSVVADELVACLLEDPSSVNEIQTLANYDLYTYVHSVGVGTLTTAIALSLGFQSPEDLRVYALGGILHDIGKKKVPIKVLNKPGPLLPEEWELMKAHPEQGGALLETLSLPQKVRDIVLLHHEKLDGSGYPNGLMSQNIPIHVQVATVADIFNALTTTRCYHRKRSRFEALMFMKHNLGGKISPEVFKALVASLTDGKELKHG
jgi:putative nucleotidyltransferase with HDIG domain